jgi:hypothetical protein
MRGPLRGHNDTPIGQPTPGRPIGRPGDWPPSGRIWCFIYMVCLTMAIARRGAMSTNGTFQDEDYNESLMFLCQEKAN